MEKKIFYLEIYKSIILSLILILLYQKLSTPSAAQVNRDAVVHDLMNLGVLAQQYFKKPTELGGGNNTFNGFSIPSNLRSTYNGEYEMASISSESVTLTGIGGAIGNNGFQRVRVTIIINSHEISTTINN